MEKISATANIISVFAICLVLWLICILGILTTDAICFVPFLTAVIYFATVLFWKTHHVSFPYYFHMTLLYLLMNNGLGARFSIMVITMIFLAIFLVFSAISIYRSQRLGIPFTSVIEGITIIYNRYLNMLKKHPDVLFRTSIHAIMIFWIGCFSLIGYSYRGYWLLVSALAVLIGEEYDKIVTRGIQRIIGAIIGFFIAGLLVTFQANQFVLIATIAATYICVFRCMPEKYIIGSACIGLQAALGNALLQDAFGYEIFIQRMAWTILGSVLTCIMCYLSGKCIKNYDAR